MAIESVKAPGGSYQGSETPQEPVTANRFKMENVTVEHTADKPKGLAVQGKQPGRNDPATAGETAEAQKPQNIQIRKAVEDINKKASNSEAVFGIHDATNRVTIKIIDKESKKVLKEYPPEKTLDMIAKVWEMAGLMVDEKR